MKNIDKNEPDLFRNYLKKNHPQSWRILSKAIGYDIRSYMLTEEQNCQCAYTEIYLSPGNSHVDHFRKQNLFPNLIFEWNNLFTSCNSDCYGARFKDSKIKREDYKYVINPAEDDTQNYFSYSITGEILAEENNEQAEITIALFNLNDYALVEQRKAAAQMVMAMRKQCTLDELVEYIGKFESFIRAIYTDFKNIEYH
ncbi:retron system putative HNH endonuclease [Desulfococcaceae bacterium HSG7]|nr:retron system putative HNH endonuclease [Desulfococcaceae bacterium HSG7]